MTKSTEVSSLETLIEACRRPLTPAQRRQARKLLAQTQEHIALLRTCRTSDQTRLQHLKGELEEAEKREHALNRAREIIYARMEMYRTTIEKLGRVISDMAQVG